MNPECPCQHCNNALEFESEADGKTIVCPHCGMETVLFIPPGQRRRIILESEVEDGAMIYEQETVTVSKTCLKVGNANYPIAAINSFRVISLPPVCPEATKWLYIFTGILSLTGILIFIAEDGYDGASAKAMRPLAIGLLAVSAIFAFYGAKIQGQSKPTFALSITTAGRDQIAVTSPDFETVQLIEAALQKAIALRG
ncbi:MAG TPA: DUF6232 family protein [Verrucomicrobiae bacterium]|nr:DUF6232 family protein [Verrucomicrobiae bacterium]